MTLSKEDKILIVGMGVMGGSYAMALSRQGYHVTALTRKPEDARYAVENGMAERAAAGIDTELIGEADIVVFALYPHIFVNWLEENQQYFKSGAIITDVTGVKGCIVDKVQDILRQDVEFIAAHPMAGREVSGIRSADDSIFHCANYIVVPTKKNTQRAIDICTDLGSVLGFARLSQLSPDEHDEMIAFLSQLTHCIAICLMTCNQKEGLENYTGDSFRDLTRIANINEVMWTELFLLNKEALLRSMHMFLDDFESLMHKIENEDVEGMYEMMRISTSRRKLFDKPKQK